MALETLTAAQEEAGRLMGFTGDQWTDVREAEQPVVHDLGMITIEGANGGELPAFRTHSGPEQATGKGGIRGWPCETLKIARGTSRELSVEMLSKLYLRNLTQYKGAKGLIVANFSKFVPEQKVSAIRQYENLMEAAGLVGHINGRSIDVPAGDIATNGQSSEYALERQRRHPEDKYWQAVITGKNPNEGGLTFRAAATGYAAWVAHCQLLEERGENHATVALQGFGNVGAWYAYFASIDPDRRISIQAIGEREGIIYSGNPEGIRICRSMVEQIGDNANYRGDKLTGLHNYMTQNGQIYAAAELRYDPDPRSITEYQMDYFVPAAMGNVITKDNVERIGAKKGVLEIANGPTASRAVHKQMVKRGLVVAPDIWVNGGGVDASDKEHNANIAFVNREIATMPSDQRIQDELFVATRNTGKTIFRMAKLLETSDLRLAAAAVSMARLATVHGISVDQRFLDIVT